VCIQIIPTPTPERIRIEKQRRRVGRAWNIALMIAALCALVEVLAVPPRPTALQATKRGTDMENFQLAHPGADTQRAIEEAESGKLTLTTIDGIMAKIEQAQKDDDQHGHE